MLEQSDDGLRRVTAGYQRRAATFFDGELSRCDVTRHPRRRRQLTRGATVISAWRPSVRDLVCLSLCVRALKEKRLEL